MSDDCVVQISRHSRGNFASVFRTNVVRPPSTQHEPPATTKSSTSFASTSTLVSRVPLYTLMPVTRPVRPPKSTQHARRPSGSITAKRSPAARICSFTPSVGFRPKQYPREPPKTAQDGLYLHLIITWRARAVTLLSSSKSLSALVFFATAYGSLFPSSLDCLRC